MDKIKEQMDASLATANSSKVINPLIWADVPDPDVIRVGSFYYMVSTTMHLIPGVPIMRSEDLVNWELISYVYEILEEDDHNNLLNGKNMYGKGSWAACLRFHEGMYYVCFASYNTDKTYIYRTVSLEHGPWERSELSGVYHDPSLLFDEGHVFLVYGNGTILIQELTEDATGIKEDGVSQVLIAVEKPYNRLNAEGSHFYKINGRYYLFLIDWPGNGNQRRIEWCYRSEHLLGKYEEKLVLDDDFYYYNNGVAQGGIVDTPEGDWYAVLFQDHGAVGRIPMLIPVSWKEGWPMMGVDGKVPIRPEIRYNTEASYPVVIKDEFNYKENILPLQWQWNHNPDHRLWSITDRPGYLRLITGSIVPNLMAARNTLSQRTVGPVFTAETLLDTAGMKPGDYAGIAAFQNNYGMLAVKVMEDGRKSVLLAFNDGTGNPEEQRSVPFDQDVVYLKIKFLFNAGSVDNLIVVDKAYFYYSFDGHDWELMDTVLPMKYTLDHFMGYRAALFCYATEEVGGFADFDYFYFDQQR